MFLEKYKYVVKENKMYKIIIDDTEVSSNDSYNEDSDGKNSDEKILIKKNKHRNIFLERIRKIGEIFKLGTRKFHFYKYKKNFFWKNMIVFFRVDFFLIFVIF